MPGRVASLEDPCDRHRGQGGDHGPPDALDATRDDQLGHRGSCRRRDRAHGEHDQPQTEHPAEADPVGEPTRQRIAGSERKQVPRRGSPQSRRRR